MAAEDWDLFAVVRSCKFTTNTATSALMENNHVSDEKNTSLPEDPLSSFGSLTFNEQHDPFTFSNLTNTGSLQNSQEPFFPFANPTPAMLTTNQGVIYPSFSMPVNGGYNGQQHQAQKVQRSRKRKNQQKKTICNVTADNLSPDPWAWRKYGQKPIKGSPYPRNYYRCSSSKGCSAKKQVERSSSDPNMFIVTYTSDHTHPRPTHHNSLSDSTQNKLKATEGSIVTATVNMQGTSDNGGKDKVALETSLDAKYGGEDDLLMDYVNVDDDLFEGLEEFIGGLGGGSSTSGGLGSNWPMLGDNWSADNSSAGATTGGDC